MLLSPTLIIVGCASLEVREGKNREPPAPFSQDRYPRARTDLEIMGAIFSKDSETQALGIGFFPFMLLDLPISTVVDTAMLPWEWNSIYKQEIKDDHNQRFEPIATTPVDSVNTNSAQAHP